jgi:periodic tryptophan protein 1
VFPADPVVQKGGKPKASLKEGSHAGAVMCLGWNRNFRQLLASGSDDKTVKLWDVQTRTALHTFTHHREPVRRVLWC